jgi:protein-S-isoprenylcysteine O-methyltransferase Ste14
LHCAKIPSRIIEVEQGQTIISSGPYAMVRHPIYLGVLPLYTLSPLALGSYWAMIPAILIIPLIVARIRNEESVLGRELKGYKEYMQKIKYRLISGI